MLSRKLMAAAACMTEHGGGTSEIAAGEEVVHRRSNGPERRAYPNGLQGRLLPAAGKLGGSGRGPPTMTFAFKAIDFLVSLSLLPLGMGDCLKRCKIKL